MLLGKFGPRLHPSVIGLSLGSLIFGSRLFGSRAGSALVHIRHSNAKLAQLIPVRQEVIIFKHFTRAYAISYVLSFLAPYGGDLKLPTDSISILPGGHENDEAVTGRKIIGLSCLQVIGIEHQRDLQLLICRGTVMARTHRSSVLTRCVICRVA